MDFMNLHETTGLADLSSFFLKNGSAFLINGFSKSSGVDSRRENNGKPI